MTMMSSSSGVTRAPRPSSLADVLDLILDKGLVIDAYVRVSAVGIEVLTIDARIVIASVDTYLHYAEAVNRLDLRTTEVEGIAGFMGDGAGSQGAQGSDGSSGSSQGNEGGRSQSGRRQEVGAGGSSARGGRQSEQAAEDDGRQKTRRQEGRRRQEGQEEGGDEEGEQRGLVARLGERGRWDS